MHGPSDVESRVLDLFLSRLNLEVPSLDTDLISEGLLDSLLLVEALLHIEQEFGVQVPLEELELDTFQSVRRIADYVRSHLDGDDPEAIGKD